MIKEAMETCCRSMPKRCIMPKVMPRVRGMEMDMSSAERQAMFTNAVRITTLWFLGAKVDIGFLYGSLHRKGGILFSLVSLSILMGCLLPLRKLEDLRGLPKVARRTDGMRRKNSNEDWVSLNDPQRK